MTARRTIHNVLISSDLFRHSHRRWISLFGWDNCRERLPGSVDGSLLLALPEKVESEFALLIFISTVRNLRGDILLKFSTVQEGSDRRKKRTPVDHRS